MGRPRHQHAPLAHYLYVKRGITDLTELSRLTGISEKTLEAYRRSQGWVEAHQDALQDQASQIESLDDVADALIRMLLQKTQELEFKPVELVDEGYMKTMKDLVLTVKMLTKELRRMAKRDKLLVMHEYLDHCLELAQGETLAAGMLPNIMETVGSYSDKVLEA